jgi:hypothetical protein
MGLVDRARARGGTLGELFQFLRRRKLWWMMPLLVLLILLGVLVVLVQTSAMNPFMYPLLTGAWL